MEHKILAILAEELAPGQAITMDTLLYDELGVNFLRAVDAFLVVEKKLHIKFPESDETLAFRTVGDIVNQFLENN